MRIERKTPRQANIRHVRLTKESKKSLKGLKYWNSSVSSAIESGDWWIPCESTLYSKLKTEFEKGMKQFFSIPTNILVEVKCFESDILGFDDGIYSDYS